MNRFGAGSGLQYLGEHPTPQDPVRNTHLTILLIAAVAGCSPAQYVYSTDPVDHRREPLPLDRVEVVVFEDGTRVPLEQPGALALSDGRFTCAQGAWDSGQVAELTWVNDQGQPERVRILTPDDLVDETDPPRITLVHLRDGESIDLDALARASATFAPNGLALDLVADGLERSIDLNEIRSIELHQPNLLDSTVLNWRFWVMAGATAAVAILVDRQTDEASLAVE